VAFLAEASRRLGRLSDHDAVVGCMVELGAPRLGDACLVFEPSDAHWAAVRACVGAGEPVLLSDSTALSELCAPLREARSCLLVPAVVGERTLAVVAFLARRARGYGRSQVFLAEDLVGRFAHALRAAEALEACRRMSEQREERLAMAVHDLMSPLAFVKGTAQFIRRLDLGDPKVAAQLRERLDSIDQACGRVVTSLTGLLIDATSFQAASRPVLDLVELTRTVIAQQQLSAHTHAVHLGSSPRSLVGEWDGNQLERLIANLLSNAIKYSPDGSTVSVSLDQTSDDEGEWAVLRITDVGIGICPADLPFIFEAYQRGSNVNGIAGSGLGLASVWHIIKQHEGRLWVDSEPGHGTTVTVRLPLPVRPAAVQPEAAQRSHADACQVGQQVVDA
jgi:signal transduction histidine kinase